MLNDLNLLPLRERPSYRLNQNPDSCNLSELLSVVIGGPKQIVLADRLIAHFGSVHKIAQASSYDLSNVPGVTLAMASRIKATLAVAKKLIAPEDDRSVINSPDKVARILMPILAHKEQEYLMVMCLDSRNRVVEIVEVYHGSLNSSMVRVAEVFRHAIKHNSAAIIIAHNHPSGDPAPSPEDVTLTRAVREAGKLLDVELLDHVVIGLNRSVSMKEKGLGF